MRPSFDDISVVIQGPIDWSLDKRSLMATTVALCRSLRDILPGAEIILSTWEGQQYGGLDFDRLILSKDPGTQGAWPSYVANNVNRQITSAVAGLKTVTRPYSLKIRPDVILESADFLDVYASLPPIPQDRRRLFARPIVSNNLTSRNSAAVQKVLPGHPLLFHPSDHVHFGLTKDLLALWDVPLQSEEDAYYFMDRSQPNRWRYHEFSRVAPEQHVLTNAIAKVTPFQFLHYADCSDALMELSRYYMESHFYFIPDRDFPIYFEKYHTDHHFSFEWMRMNPGTIVPAPSPPPRSLGWKLSYPIRNPAGFRRWLKRKFA